MKVIAISNLLADLKPKLENLGYVVYFENEITSPIDAYIYTNNHGQNSLYSITQTIDHSFQSQSNNDHDHGGTLLINGENKTLDEIVYVLENRVYSPFFGRI